MTTSKKHKVCLQQLIFLLLLPCLLFISARAQTDDEYTQYLPVINRDHNPYWTWLPKTSLELVPRPNHIPLLAIDRDGIVHLFWDTYTTPRFIYHTYYDGQTWTAPEPITQTLGISNTIHPPIFDAQGTMHLIWHNYLGSGVSEPDRLLYSTYNGTWGPEEEIYRTSIYTLKAIPQFDSSGGILAAIIETFFFSGNLYQAQRGLSGWTVSSPIVAPHPVDWVWPDMNGGLHLFGDDTNQVLYYSYWRGGSFEIENQQSTGIVDGRETQLDGQDNLHVFWRGEVAIPGETVNGLYHQCLAPDLSWTPELVLTGQQAVIETGVAATDWAARSVIAWEEGDPARFRVGLWEGCERVAALTIPQMEAGPDEIEAVAISATPFKFCALTRESYTTHYELQCADIRQ